MLWLPEYFPGTLILDQAPPEYATATTLELGPLDVVQSVPSGVEGHEVMAGDRSGALHLRLRTEAAWRRPAFLIPFDAIAELRLDVALYLVRRLHGHRANLLPPALSLTRLQRMRLIHLLHAYDVRSMGGGPRDVAEKVLVSDQASLPSVEWKDSHARRRANRLIHDSIALVERGYLKLLRGG